MRIVALAVGPWALLALSCGGRSRTLEANETGGSAGTALTSGGTAGNGTGGEVGGGGRGSAGGDGGRAGQNACTPLGNRPATPPPGIGCYAFEEGAWVRLPCSCQLVLENAVPERIRVEIRLNPETGDLTPYPGDLPSITVGFADADGSFFSTWERQKENGTTFIVTRAAPNTVVSLLGGSLRLDDVWLEPCESRAAWARVVGPTSLSGTVEHLHGDVSGQLWPTACSPPSVPPLP